MLSIAQKLNSVEYRKFFCSFLKFYFFTIISEEIFYQEAENRNDILLTKKACRKKRIIYSMVG